MIWLLAMLFFVMPLWAQKKKSYDIFLNKKEVGHYSVMKSGEGDKTIYAGKAEVQPGIPMVKTLSYSIKSVYSRGFLLRSVVEVTVNGKPHKTVTTKWKSDHYEFVENGAVKEKVEKKIRVSSCVLFFEEPDDLDRFYSEFHGREHELEKKSFGKYKVEKEDGKTTYKYRNGELQRFVFDHWLADLSFKYAGESEK